MLRALPLLVLACAGSWAQKAKPLEIPLRDGEGAVQGRLKGRQEADYAVAAGGKVLAIALSAEPMRTLSVRMYDPDGAPVALQKEGAGRWSAALSKGGMYRITVLRTAPSAPASTYRLTVKFPQGDAP